MGFKLLKLLSGLFSCYECIFFLLYMCRHCTYCVLSIYFLYEHFVFVVNHINIRFLMNQHIFIARFYTLLQHSFDRTRRTKIQTTYITLTIYTISHGFVYCRSRYIWQPQSGKQNLSSRCVIRYTYILYVLLQQFYKLHG